MRELASVCDNEHRSLAVLGLDLVQRRQHKHGRLAHACLGLADNIGAQNSLGNALVLDLRGMLEAAVGDGLEELGLEEEVAEPRAVHRDVRALGDRLGGGGGGYLLDVLFVVGEQFFLCVSELGVTGVTCCAVAWLRGYVRGLRTWCECSGVRRVSEGGAAEVRKSYNAGN